MSAKDEARYAAAIEKAEAVEPSAIPPDAVYVVTYGDVDEPVLNAAPNAPARSFDVAQNDYDAFFSQSPAVILARLSLDPIVDGGKLLGYRIVSIQPFDGVDLQKEDIIIGVDGVLPKNPDDYFNSWQKAKSASGCVVNIQRGLDRHDLVWKVK